MYYNAVIFDFDFTLADAAAGIVECVNSALCHLGYQSKKVDDIKKTVGMTLKETFQILTGNSDNITSEKFVTLFKEKADIIMTNNTVLYPDTVVTLDNLKKSDIKIGIVTSKLHYRIDEVLAKYSIVHLIDYIVGFEDVKTAKPLPEGLYKAVQHLNVDKSNVLYVGDSLIDAQTAINAGVNFLAVTTGTTTAADFRKYDHVAIIENLTQLFDIPDICF